MKKLLMLSIPLLLSTSIAEELPVPSKLDNKIQEIIYNPDNVTIVKVQAGVATLIQLSEDEYIGGSNVSSGFAIGDPEAWNISIRQNNIFLRPKAEMPDTNVIFTTNKRTYSVILSSAVEQEAPTFLLRYKYPQDDILKAKALRESKAKEQREMAQRKREEMIIPCTDGGWINTDYQVRGSSEIKPIHIWDDGTFTCFKWSAGSSLPVAYKKFGNGKEQITNSHMEKDILVVHEVSKEFVLRFGDEVLDVKTDRNIKKGFNSKATTVNNQALIKK